MQRLNFSPKYEILAGLEAEIAKTTKKEMKEILKIKKGVVGIKCGFHLGKPYVIVELKRYADPQMVYYEEHLRVRVREQMEEIPVYYTV